jgi:anion-transporting  ArsA/GET3 family ATPase
VAQPRPDTSALFKARVLFISGKGGTGKTTLAVALGHLAAAQGRRTVIVELDSQRPALTPYFRVTPTYEPVDVGRNLSISNVAWGEALEDWVAGIVSMRRIVRLIMQNKVVQVFLNVTPGARDLVVLWRIMELASRYDTVIVDMPASGNAVAMLTVPVTAERLFAAGPIRKCATDLLALFARPDTRGLLVGLPEEMVVNETIETARRIRRDVPGLRVPMVVLNRAAAPTLTEAEINALNALEGMSWAGTASEVIEAGQWEAELEAATTSAEARIGVEAPVLALPVFARSEGLGKLISQVAGAVARSSASPVDWRGVVS